jgi:NitT/TauT family transport system ATP-binding protein
MDICLRASNLSKAFGDLLVLDRWNLEIKKGERVAILGPSGCGKTTFLRLVAGLDSPTYGTLHLTGQKVGYVFQEPRLIPWKTVKENLLFITPEGDYQKILAQLGLQNFANYYPPQISGGMLQRVNLARALLIKPDLLILDEAFFSLDMEIKFNIMQEIINTWKREKFSLIAVTHDPKDALTLADRILFLSGQPSRIKEDFRIEWKEQAMPSSFEFSQLEAKVIQKIIARSTVY